MKEAIELAKSDKAGDKMYFWDPPIDCECACDNSVLLDPLFWQALGKALGWKGITGRIYNREAENSYDTLSEPLYQMHRFIDHLAEGKDAESFFNNLLPHDL